MADARELEIPQKKLPERLLLDYINLDDRLQSRRLRPDVVEEYAAAMRRGSEFPPIRVVRDGNDKHYLVDGHHRLAATRQLNGTDSICVEIIDGTFTDALWHSWAANRAHGLRRTQEEKRWAIKAALEHPTWSKKSDCAIGRHIGCDHKTVGAMRRRLNRREFPEGKKCTVSQHPSWPTKKQILKACSTLAQVQPEQARQFDNSELAIVRQAHEHLHRLLYGARTLRPSTQLPQGGTNVSHQQIQ